MASRRTSCRSRLARSRDERSRSRPYLAVCAQRLATGRASARIRPLRSPSNRGRCKSLGARTGKTSKSNPGKTDEQLNEILSTGLGRILSRQTVRSRRGSMADLPIVCTLTPDALRVRRDGLLSELLRQSTRPSTSNPRPRAAPWRCRRSSAPTTRRSPCSRRRSRAANRARSPSLTRGSGHEGGEVPR